jgi:hypothetical protein
MSLEYVLLYTSYKEEFCVPMIYDLAFYRFYLNLFGS